MGISFINPFSFQGTHTLANIENADSIFFQVHSKIIMGLLPRIDTKIESESFRLILTR